jgi:hypothetical protein
MVPNAFFQKYVVYSPNGAVDTKKSVKSFEEDFTAWCKEQGDLKPAIISELQNYKRLGEGKLVAFTMRALSLQPNKEKLRPGSTALNRRQPGRSSHNLSGSTTPTDVKRSSSRKRKVST